MTRLTQAALVALLLFASPALAQPPATVGGEDAPADHAPPPMPANVAELDAALDSHDYATLDAQHATLHTVDQALPFMSWERARLLDGGGLYLSLLYMNDLWRLAKAVPPTEPNAAGEIDALKGSAVLIGLYSYELIALDGAKCADVAAPARWSDQLAQSPVWAHASEIPAAQRAKMIDMIMIQETQTASRRGRDDLLCRGGKTPSAAAAQAGPGQARPDVQSGPGIAGAAFALPPPPRDQTLFVDLMVWGPKQSKLRDGMRAELAKLLKLDTPKAAGKR
jgi:hypothetical protein